MATSDTHPRQQRAQTCYQYGHEAAKRNNFDYAIQMFGEASKLVPENLAYRQALRAVERLKFGNDPSKVGRMVGMKLQHSRLRISAARAKKQWAHVLEVCEDIFVHSPWDVSAARDAAEAAEHLGLKDLARWSIESVHAQADGDAHFLRHAAHIFELVEDYQRAISCWERVRKLAPGDDEAKRQIRALSANATIARSGLTEALSRSGPSAAPNESFAPDRDELKQLSLGPEERLNQEIEQHPDRIGSYLELADIHKMHNRLDEAEKVLARGLKANPDEPLLQTARAEVQISRLHRALAAWTKRVEDHPDDADARIKLRQLTETCDAYELNEYRRRLEQNPDDPNLHYQVGLRLVRAGQYDEAIAAFQQARGSASHKAEALHQLGLAFEAKGLPKLAERNYQEALKAADPRDQAQINALNYRLGRVFEAQGILSRAEEHYNEVAANDYGYLDVAQRLNGLGQRAGG